jgi:hypothetical protein
MYCGSVLGQLGGPSAFDDAARRAVLGLAASAGAPMAPEALESPGGRGCPVLDFAASGAMWLTGDHRPVAFGLPLLAHLRALCSGIAALSGSLGAAVELDPALVLCGRAAARGFLRHGRRSANGSCRLLEGSDAWMACNLPRPSDLELLGAIVECAPGADPWVSLERAAQRSGAAELVERAQLVGVAAAVLDLEAPEHRRPPVAFTSLGAAATRTPRRPRVVDFSAMWAGPLCASILSGSGAEVSKVEDPARPDAARLGDPLLYRRLHDGHQLVEVSFSTPAGRGALHRLVEEADVVVESSRPRALAQLGLTPEAFLAGGEGRVWISITGYGRSGPGGNRVAFGDDAAVAGGLVAWAGPNEPVFCADAAADPISGLYAGFGGLAALTAGGGLLVDVSMSDASAATRSGPNCGERHNVERDAAGRWHVRHGDRIQAVLSPAEVASPVRA